MKPLFDYAFLVALNQIKWLDFPTIKVEPRKKFRPLLICKGLFCFLRTKAQNYGGKNGRKRIRSDETWA